MNRIAAVTSVLFFTIGLCGCSTGRTPDDKHVAADYDTSGRLQLLKYDSKGRGQVDTWSYMDGARILRIEIDQDGDHLIDRWEYFGPDQTLQRVGRSRANDGKEDAWWFPGAGGEISRLEMTTRRDGRIDRIEYYEHNVMVRAEEDTDDDGKVDKWELYDGARLASVAFDTLHRGAPDRRLTYGANGSTSLELDPDGDGQFRPVSAAAVAARPTIRQ